MKKAMYYTVLGAGMIVLLVFSPACKTADGAANYDIRGNWTFLLTYSDNTSEYWFFTFSGEKNSGTVTHTYLNYPGTYTVSGDSVEFTIEYLIFPTRTTERYTGQFQSANSMSGTYEWDTTIGDSIDPPIVWEWGSWTATRN